MLDPEHCKPKLAVATRVVGYDTLRADTPPVIVTDHLQRAGDSRDSQQELLKAATHTFTHDSVLASLLQKHKPYSTDGLDGMIVVTPVAIENRNAIQHIGQLTEKELKEILQDCAMVLRTHLLCAEELGLTLGQQAIGVNFHFNPMDLRDYERTVYAQSVRPLHFHTTSWTNEEDSQPAQLIRLHRDDFDSVRDPLARLVNKILRQENILEILLSDRSNLSVAGIRNGSLILETSDGLNPESLALALLQLHHGANTLYQLISEQLIHPDLTDEMGFPIPNKTTLNGETDSDQPSANPATDTVRRHMQRLRSVLQPGQEALEQRKRLFLRGLAYTICIVQKPNQSNWQVIFTPRLISTGNMLDSLGMVRVFVSNDHPQRWNEQQSRRNAVVQANLQSITNAGALHPEISGSAEP